MTPISLLLTALLGSICAEDIDLRYGMRSKSSGGFTGNRHGFRALRAIVTGLPHAGTTVTAAILFNAPCVIGALETGFLLAKKPSNIREVHPWIEWNTDMEHKDWYMLKPGDVNAIAHAENFPQMLDVLRNRSHLFNNLIDEPYCDKPYQMIDKTPKYVNKQHFERILHLTHGANVPVIVLKKSIEFWRQSLVKRGLPFGRHTYQNYNETYNNVERMIHKYPNRIMVINFDDMVLNVEAVMQQMFDFIGLEWRTDYLKMTNLKKKFAIYGDRYANELVAQWRWKFK